MILLVIVVVIVGLPTRLAPQYMPAFMVRYGGDALWALLIYLLLRLMLPSASGRQIAVLALAATWGIEISQLIQTDWLNAIRSVKPVGLILGYTFLWSDLLCYLVGIGAGVLFDQTVLKGRSSYESQNDSTRAD
jgi:hypothetical protein